MPVPNISALEHHSRRSTLQPGWGTWDEREEEKVGGKRFKRDRYMWIHASGRSLFVVLENYPASTPHVPPEQKGNEYGMGSMSMWDENDLYNTITFKDCTVHLLTVPQVLTVVALSIVAVCVLFLATNSKRS